MVPTPESVRNHRGGPGYPRHSDYSGFHHGGTDGLIRAELGSLTRTLTVSQVTNKDHNVENGDIQPWRARPRYPFISTEVDVGPWKNETINNIIAK